MNKKVFFLLFLAACSSPKLQMERVFIGDKNELYVNGELKTEVKVNITDRFVDRSKSRYRMYLRKTYVINNHPVMFEFINPSDSFPTRLCYVGPNMWDDYDLRGPSLAYRRFYQKKGVIKEIYYHEGFDSLKRRKFEGHVEKIVYLKGEVRDSLCQEWYQWGYKRDTTLGKYFWQQWTNSIQLKEQSLYRNGNRIKYSCWSNNGMLNYSTDSMTINKDSTVEIRFWHKNGLLNNIRIEDKEGLWIKDFSYNNFGKLIQKQDIINGRGEIKSAKWSLDGDWKYVNTTIGSETETLQYYKNTLVAKIVSIDEKRYSADYFTNDSSMYYILLAKNLPYFANETYSREEYSKKRDEYFGFAILHDSTNITACINKLKNHYIGDEERDKLEKHLLTLDNELFDSEELLSVKLSLNLEKVNQYDKRLSVLSTAIKKATMEGNARNLQASYKRRAFIYYKIKQYNKACEDISKFIEHSFLNNNRGEEDLNQLKFKYREIIEHCN